MKDVSGTETSICVHLHQNHDTHLFILKGTTVPSVETTRAPLSEPITLEGYTGEVRMSYRGDVFC
jgi:hypothetical protein